MTLSSERSICPTLELIKTSPKRELITKTSCLQPTPNIQIFASIYQLFSAYLLLVNAYAAIEALFSPRRQDQATERFKLVQSANIAAISIVVLNTIWVLEEGLGRAYVQTAYPIGILLYLSVLTCIWYAVVSLWAYVKDTIDNTDKLESLSFLVFVLSWYLLWIYLNLGCSKDLLYLIFYNCFLLLLLFCLTKVHMAFVIIVMASYLVLLSLTKDETEETAILVLIISLGEQLFYSTI